MLVFLFFQENYLEQILKNILNINVGVDCKGLMNEVLERETDHQYLLVELNKLFKQHNRLDLYIRLSFQQANLSNENEDIFPRKVVFQILHFVVSHVVSLSLFGSNQNFKLFLKMVKKVVFGSRHQKFSLSSVVSSFATYSLSIGFFPNFCFIFQGARVQSESHSLVAAGIAF